MGTRWVFVGGYWQLIQAVSGMNSVSEYAGANMLMLFNSTGNTQRDAKLEQFARSCFQWDHIAWVSDVVVPQMPSEEAMPYGIQTLRALGRKHNSSPGQLWLTGIHRQWEKMVLSAFPKTPVYLYEDGLASYYNHAYSCGIQRLRGMPLKHIGRWLKRELSHYTNSECDELLEICVRDAKRVRAICLSLLRLLSGPSCFPRNRYIDCSKAAKGVIAELNDYGKGCNSSTASILLLGDMLYSVGAMSWEKECLFYAKLIREIRKKGFRLFWKDHPRNDRPFYNELCGVEGVSLATEDYKVPAELLITKYCVKAVIANASTSLFNAKLLYDIPTYTYCNVEWRIYHDSYDQWVYDLVHKHIPHYSSHFGA